MTKPKKIEVVDALFDLAWQVCYREIRVRGGSMSVLIPTTPTQQEAVDLLVREGRIERVNDDKNWYQEVTK